jgi:hypothetical protein
VFAIAFSSPFFFYKTLSVTAMVSSQRSLLVSGWAILGGRNFHHSLPVGKDSEKDFGIMNGSQELSDWRRRLVWEFA